MRKIVRSLLISLVFIGLGALVSLVAAAVVALWHVIDTPQPLESILPGEARIYRWRRGHIFYKMLGDENAPPLVLLHAPGIGASAYEMRKVIGALAQHYHVYALDLLGFGLSDHPQIDYSAETYVTLCHDFLTEVVTKPATLLASGLSCNYAVIVAKRFPQTCARLVLISPSALFGGEQTQRTWPALMENPVVRFLLYPTLSTRMALRYAMSRQLSAHQGPASDVDYLYASTHQFGAEHAVMALLAGKLATDASQEFDKLPQPTLVIWGARALNDTRFIAGQQNMPTQTEIALIQDAGVYVHEEYPALVVANILEWSQEGKTEVAAVATASKSSGEVKKSGVKEPMVREGNDSRPSESGTEETLLAYCARCKKKTPMKDAQEVTMKNGNPAVKGKCSVCGAGQYRIGRL